jgi:hypothetical protein
MLSKHVPIVSIALLFAISQAYTKNYSEKGSFEIGGNANFNSIDNDLAETKQYVFAFEPIFNYYVARGWYVGPAISYTGYIIDKNEYPGLTLYNHYKLSLGARAGFSNTLSNTFGGFVGMGMDYTINKYWDSRDSYKGKADGFALNPFIGIKLLANDRVAFPLTVGYRIGVKSNSIAADINVTMGIVGLLY